MVELLTKEERAELPLVKLRRDKFRTIIRKSIENIDTSFSNCIMIIGDPGTGKTSLVTEYLEVLREDGLIHDFKRCSGHLTKSSLFEFLRPEDDAEKVEVHILDDVDCIHDNGCLEIMKSTFDTRNNNQKSNRYVTSYRQGSRDSYKYNGFCIIITNHKFEKYNVNQQALFDRIHRMEIDLKASDFLIFITSLIEDYLNENPDGLSDYVIENIANFYNDTIRKWFELNAFGRTNTHFSVRLIKKFIDLMMMFGDDWKEYSIDYKRLNSAL